MKKNNNVENSNGLENFELNEREQLFSTQMRNNKNEIDVENFNSETEEDELEIPAFLKKTKKLMIFEKINECHHRIG